MATVLIGGNTKIRGLDADSKLCLTLGAGGITIPLAFNRTIVELKLCRLVVSSPICVTFNRTIVELKPQWKSSGFTGKRPLIEPLWN